MKLLIVLSVFVVCAYTAPLKTEILQRANALDQNIKSLIQKLTEEKREHLALPLEEEEKRLEALSSELGKVADSDEVRIASLEDQLITLESRVAAEVNILQRQTATQELLESDAKMLKKWVAEEIQILNATEGSKKHKAEQAIKKLEKEEKKLDEIIVKLDGAQTQKQIERFEVELRAMEIRLWEELKDLHFVDSTPTARPVTVPVTSATARPSSARPSSARPSSARPSSARPSSARPSSARPSSARPSSARPSSAQPSSARPSSARPSSARPSSAQPSSARPSTAAPVSKNPIGVH